MKTYTAHCIDGGYFAYERKITVDDKLTFLPCAQAGIIRRNNSVLLMSYATVAADITDGWLTVSCLCSNTTRRHVSAFLKEFAPSIDYYVAKKCFNEGLQINIETGEIRELSAA